MEAKSSTSRSSIPSQSGQPKQRLRLIDCIGLTVGIIIGAGIYDLSPSVAREVGSPWGVPLVWLAGGVVILLGAVGYAELVAAYPEAGGDYAFLTRSYGRHVGFLFAWCDFWIIRPGNLGVLALLFASFASQTLPLVNDVTDQIFYAVVAIVGLTYVNIWGVRPGKWTQNCLTAFKLLGLFGIILVGCCYLPVVEWSPPGAETSRFGGVGLAMVFVVFTFGGWSEISYVAAEIEEPQTNTWKALSLGLITVTVIYLGLNLVFLTKLGYESMCSSNTVVSDLLRAAFPHTELGARFVSLLIAASTLGSVNGMILTGSRIYYALGRDHASFAWLGAWNHRRDCPTRSLYLQALVTTCMVIWFGRLQDGLEMLVVFTTPVYYSFFLLVMVSIIIQRRRDPDRVRPHRTPFYPFPILLFGAVCAYVIVSSTRYAWWRSSEELEVPSEFFWFLLVFGSGLAVVFVSRREPPVETPS